MTISSFFELPDGYYNINQIMVNSKDAAGNVSTSITNLSAITIDTVAPDKPSVTFPNSLTHTGVVTVSLASSAVLWEYSINTGSGENWIAGVGTTFLLPDGIYSVGVIAVRNTDLAGNVSAATTNDLEINADIAFTLPDGTYNVGSVLVRATDIAGNVSTIASNKAEFVIDTVPPNPPMVVFPSIPTNDGTVTITMAIGAASWEYSDDAGDTWNNGTGTTFILQSDPTGHITYPVGEVMVRNTDLAGNVSTATSNISQVTILQPIIITSSDTATFYGGATNILVNATAMLSGYPNVTKAIIVGHAAIGDNAFKDATGLSSLTISEITTWDTGFGTSFTLPVINNIGSYAFQNTGLTDVDIPVDVVTIGEDAFKSTSLSTISIPWETTIGTDAFSNMTISLLTVTITGISTAVALNTWKSNNDSKFSGIGEITIIFITGTNGIMTETVGDFGYVFTVVSSTNVQIGDGSNTPGNGMTTPPVSTLPNFTLSSGTTYLPNVIQVRSIDAAGNKSTVTTNTIELFVYDTMTFTLPTTFLGGYFNVIQVGTSAFQNIPITDVTIPTNITSIGVNAFTGIGYVSPTVVGTIPPMVIVDASASVTELKTWMSTYGASFSGNNNMSVVFSTTNEIMIEMIDGIEYVFTFMDTAVNKNVRVGTGDSTGAANGIVGSTTTDPLTLNIPNTFRGTIYPVVQIGTRAFYQLAVLGTAMLPGSVVTIEESAFFETGLMSIAIPSGVTDIGINAFANIPTLRYVRVPHTGVTYAVGSFFYMNQYSVVSVYGITLPPELITWKKSIPTPSSSDGTYQIFRASNDGIVKYVMENGQIMARFHEDIIYIITRIDVTSTTDLNVRIGTGTTIPGNGVHGPLTTTISPPTGFVGFFNGQACTYPLTQVGKYAFNSTGLTGVVIPNTVEKINIHAFSFDDFNPIFNSVTFASESQCETIDSYAFMYAGITEIIIPDSVTAIGQSAFRWNGLLSDITLPVSVVMPAPAFRYLATEVVVKVVTNWWYTFLDWREQNLDKFSTKDLSEVTMTPYYDGQFLFDYIEDAMCAICNTDPISVPVNNAEIAAATEDLTIIPTPVLGDPIQHVFGGEFPPGGDVTWSRKYGVIPFPMTADIVALAQNKRKTLALEHTKTKISQTKAQRIADMTRARSRLNHNYASQSESETNYNTHNYIQVDFFQEDHGVMCARAGHRVKSPYLGPVPGTFSIMSQSVSVTSSRTFQSLPSVSSRLNNNHIIPITIPDIYTPSYSPEILSSILIDGTVASP